MSHTLGKCDCEMCRARKHPHAVVASAVQGPIKMALGFCGADRVITDLCELDLPTALMFRDLVNSHVSKLEARQKQLDAIQPDKVN